MAGAVGGPHQAEVSRFECCVAEALRRLGRHGGVARRHRRVGHARRGVLGRPFGLRLLPARRQGDSSSSFSRSQRKWFREIPCAACSPVRSCQNASIGIYKKRVPICARGRLGALAGVACMRRQVSSAFQDAHIPNNKSTCLRQSLHLLLSLQHQHQNSP